MIPKLTFGRTGHLSTRTLFGAAAFSEVSQAEADRTLELLYKYGVNHIDTAASYGDAELRLGPWIARHRNDFFLASKTGDRTYKEAKESIHRSLERLQTDHLDCVHLHNVGRMERWPDMDFLLKHEEGALAGLIEAKKQGLIGHIGCSTHMRVTRVLPAFAIDHIELFMCPINFVDRHIYNFEEKVLPEARKNNIGIIAMKALGGPVKPASAQISDPRDYPMAMRYAWGVPGVAVVNLGMRNPDELRIALAAARSYKPFEASELSAVTARGKELAAKWGGPTRGPIA